MAFGLFKNKNKFFIMNTCITIILFIFLIVFTSSCRDENQQVQNEFELEKEISYLEKETLKSPDYKNYYNLGVNYFNKKEYEKSIKNFELSIKTNPDFVKAHINRGVVYYTKGKYEIAIESFKKAIQLDPTNGKAYYNLALAYYAIEKYDRVNIALKHAAYYNPELTLKARKIQYLIPR